MKDVEKTSFERENNIKRLRRRKRGMGLYGLIVIILVIGTGITVSCTFLFNVSEIRLKGNSDIYSSDYIIQKSGAKMGSNLIKLDTDKIRQNILNELVYIEDVKVRADFPATLEIEIESCVPAFNVKYELGTILISGKGKILENAGTQKDELPTFYGYKPKPAKCGEVIDSDDEKQKEVFEEFMKIMYQRENTDNIEYVDISSRSNVIIKFRDGNVFKMGNWNDFEYKLTLAERVINETGKTGYITMVGTNQCSFRTTDGSFSSSVITTQPASSQTGSLSTETTTATETSENQEQQYEYYENSESSEYQEDITENITEDDSGLYQESDDNSDSDENSDYYDD